MALINQAEAFDCTPSSLLASTPCLKCLSEHEMIAVIVALMALAAGKTIPEVMSDGACFTCLSDKEMLQALVTKLGNDLLGERYTVQDVIDTYHCLVCAPDKQLRAAILQMLCADFTVSLTQA